MLSSIDFLIAKFAQIHQIFFRDIPYFEETLRFTISLPNMWNVTFHFPTILRIYLLLLFFPGKEINDCIKNMCGLFRLFVSFAFLFSAMYIMMSHMYKDRARKLGSKKWVKKYY